MRVKQTAKKITNENGNELPTSDNSNDVEYVEQSSCDNINDTSDNEVEILVECRRDQEGNQFLLDGTLVIEPAAVDISNEYKENQDLSKEINFDDFLKEIENKVPNDNIEKENKEISKRSAPISTPDQSIHGTVKCTACNNRFEPIIGKTIFKHPLLEVILCSECIQNQKDEFFVIDKEDNKETLCRWCVEGGSLICCDFCPKSFCKTCIKRNLGRNALLEILNQDDSVQWRCFACDPKIIEPLKILCRKVFGEIHESVDKPRIEKKKPISKLSEIINKKRSISKAFPNDSVNGSPNVSSPKLAKPQSAVKPNSSNTVVLLNNMANFGTEWYMRNVKLRNIFTEIDEIDSRTLLNAINSTKKCVEAFYSDIRNLEVEISKASTASDIPAIVSMFKSVYRHHIFNRFCQVKTRIEEDKKTKFVVPPPHNGNGESTQGVIIRNTNSIPNLVINNVVSTAPCVSRLSTFTPSLIAQGIKNGVPNLSNGGLNVMASIDLTDEPDRNECDDKDEIADKAEVDMKANTSVVVSRKNSITLPSPSNGAHEPENDVVDLCEDEDSVADPIVVNMDTDTTMIPVAVDRCTN